MNKPIYDFFTQDHRRIEEILEEAIKDIDNIDLVLYAKFRIELLTHIKMEEKGLFKAAQLANGDKPIPLAKQLRLEHGAITSLMVPPPNPDLIKVLKHILEAHDLKEEEPGGMYDICEKLTKMQTEELLNTVKNFPKTPLHPHKDIPLAWSAAKRACERAGFNYDEIIRN
ncbi:MAG: hemerythrin domain-containing protein [Brumimicrobium sp.]